MTYLKPVVAEVSPNLYSAAKSANLNGQEINQVTQMSYAIKKHRELMKLDSDTAKKEFNKLDETAQQQLQFLFKDADYAKDPESVGRKILGTIGNTAHLFASPLIGLFKLGGQYNRLINLPYKVGRQVAQGEDFFSKKVWDDAWNGTNMWDRGALADVTKYYGSSDVFVAKGLLQGKTPGEILESYGQIDNKIIESIKKAYDENSNFNDIKEAVKYAQISPGRDIARMLDSQPPSNGGLAGDYLAGRHKGISGNIDFVYQIAIDPLTWLTGGFSKGVTKGERIAKTVIEMINNDVPAERAIAHVFETEPKLTEFWNNLGPAIKTYSEATGAAKAQAFNDIARRFPGYNNRTVIEGLAKKDAHLPNGVVDAASAQKYFENASNLNLLLAGRVDGLSYMRNGVAIARNRRMSTDGLVSYLDGVFNSTNKTTIAGAGRTAAEVDTKMEPIIASLVNSQDAIERLANPATSDFKVLLEANNEIRSWRNGMRLNPKWIGKQASRSAAGLEVQFGEHAVQTASNFTARARQILPKDMAEALTVKFLDSTMDEQIVILRNLDAATMYSMGLGGERRGIELMQKILDSKYGNLGGFALKRDEAINPEHAKVMPEASVKVTDDGTFINGTGPMHNYQYKKAVGSLPYDEIGSMVWNIKAKNNVVNVVGGATQSAFSKKIVDAWSILTLFPRLGIRSAIDEGVMFALAAPGRDLRAYALLGKGRKSAYVARAFSGSEAGTGPIRKGLQKALELGGKKSATLEKWSRAKYISPEDAINAERRVVIIQDLAKKLDVDEALLTNMEKRLAIVDEVFNVYNRYLDPSAEKYLRQAFVHNPDALTSVANSIVARSGVSGEFGKDAMAAIISPTNLDRAMAELDVKFNAAVREIDMRTLSDREAALVHYEQFVKKFVGNQFKMVINGKDKTILNPAEIFFRYNGLKPGEIDAKTGKQMFELALDKGMQDLGFKFNKATGGWVVDDFKKVSAYLQQSAYTTAGRQAGMTNAEIARAQLGRMFNDMYVTFHGSANKYNEELMNLMTDSYKGLSKALVDTDKVATWNTAAARLTLDSFADASIENRISGFVNSPLGVGNYADTESLFRRFGNSMMEMMDNQVNGIFRQPAVMVAYTGLRKKYAGIEKNYVRQYVEHKAAGFPLTDADKAKFTAEGEALAEKHFTEVAMREAADTILKYADNPSIRSNFAYAMRTMGRYYRATEDFYRRIYRLKDVSPRVLYRMRLMHLGLGATGFVHTDANNEPYIIMPMDNVIFKATENTMRALTGNTGYSQPQFNELTMKLRMMNPSFTQDAGVPTLSGPIAGLSVVAFKNILGSVPGSLPFVGKYIDPAAENVAKEIDTYALGNIGENMDVTRAIVPASLQKIWAILPYNEKSRQEVTAAQQAMAYNAAHGLYLDANATPEQKTEYLKQIRISAHNVIALRNFLGLIAPVGPTMQDSMGVPDYIKDTGVTSLRAEFFDILNSISKDNTGDVQDPYELALATFTGKNPGKLIYTVSTSNKETKVVIKNTSGLDTWATNNKNFIKTYGQTAYIFAPQTGQFNAATYNWIQAAGLTSNKTLEAYYDDLLVAEDKQAYYDIARNEKQALANESDPMLRANIINAATNSRQALKDANPLLEPALIGQGNNIGEESVMLDTLQSIIENPSSPVRGATRKRMNLAIKLMRDYITFCENPELKNVVNATELKAARKDQVEAGLQELMAGDLYVTEANRAIFRSILGFYSRDSYYAVKELR